MWYPWWTREISYPFVSSTNPQVFFFEVRVVLTDQEDGDFFSNLNTPLFSEYSSQIKRINKT